MHLQYGKSPIFNMERAPFQIHKGPVSIQKEPSSIEKEPQLIRERTLSDTKKSAVHVQLAKSLLANS